MPVTRRQAASKQQSTGETAMKKAPRSREGGAKKDAKAKEEREAVAGEKREAEVEGKTEETKDEPHAKKLKMEGAKKDRQVENVQESQAQDTDGKCSNSHSYQTGTIERGHIYFFYRPKVEEEEAESLDDVQRFYMLLIPRPPAFAESEGSEGATKSGDNEGQEMKVLQHGADAILAGEPKGQTKKAFRLMVIGKKGLPDPDSGKGKHQVFWATTTTVGEDLKKLQEGLEEKTYQTKTKGERHQAAARLAARGAYAIVNKEARVPSDRETHIGYHLSHPAEENWGDVQKELGLHTASSFVLQVKNPLAPPTGPGRVGLPKSRTVDYPEYLMEGVFGKGGSRGRESFGLRFASVEAQKLLDYEGVEFLFIAARAGDQGLETSLGEGRGEALKEKEREKGQEEIQDAFKEVAMDTERIPADPLRSGWAA